MDKQRHEACPQIRSIRRLLSRLDLLCLHLGEMGKLLHLLFGWRPDGSRWRGFYTGRLKKADRSCAEDAAGDVVYAGFCLRSQSFGCTDSSIRFAEIYCILVFYKRCLSALNQYEYMLFACWQTYRICLGG